jgi:hypothetical protein
MSILSMEDKILIKDSVEGELMQRLYSNLPLRRYLFRIVYVYSLSRHLVQVLQRKTCLQSLYFLRFIRKERRKIQWTICLLLNAFRFLGFECYSLGTIELQILLFSSVLIRITRSLLAKALLWRLYCKKI